MTICAECDRFLYNMMRLISGTLVEVGLGRISADDVSMLLACRGRGEGSNASGIQVVKAPAKGLTLQRCFYDVDGHGSAAEWLEGYEGLPDSTRPCSSSA